MRMRDLQDLIIEVEKYPCLWNISDSNYQNKLERDLAWDEICKKLNPNWNEIEDTREIKETTKKQWNYVRDSFRKYINRIKETPTISGGTLRKKFTFADNLSFLIPVFQNKLSRKGILLEPETVENEQQRPNEDSNEEDEEERNRRKLLRKDELKKAQNKPKQKRPEDIPQQILNIMKKRTNEPHYHDEDSQFLLSFRSDMRGMSKSRKLKFKLGMIQLIQDMTERETRESYASTPSPIPPFPTTSFDVKIENFRQSCSTASTPSPSPHFSNNETENKYIIPDPPQSTSSFK